MRRYDSASRRSPLRSSPVSSPQSRGLSTAASRRMLAFAAVAMCSAYGSTASAAFEPSRGTSIFSITLYSSSPRLSLHSCQRRRYAARPGAHRIPVPKVTLRRLDDPGYILVEAVQAFLVEFAAEEPVFSRLRQLEKLGGFRRIVEQLRVVNSNWPAAEEPDRHLSQSRAVSVRETCGIREPTPRIDSTPKDHRLVAGDLYYRASFAHVDFQTGRPQFVGNHLGDLARASVLRRDCD